MKFNTNFPIPAIIALCSLLAACGGGNNEQAYYELGETGPGGGKVFLYIREGFKMSDADETCYFLEAAPIGELDSEDKVAWASPEYTAVNIASTGTALGTGRNNTKLILAADPNAPAAKKCRDYRGPKNKDDWFLPSKKELDWLEINRGYAGYSGSGFNDDYFWSSTQVNPTRADTQSIYLRVFSTSLKSTGNMVWAIRAF